MSNLQITAERIVPPKPSLRLTEELYALHPYHKDANLSNPMQQKYFSLLGAWYHVLHHIQHHPALGQHDFAIVMEDDISLHWDLSTAAAQAAILHGFDLARADGWLNLGICPVTYFKDTEQVYQGLKYARIFGWCGHALAFTKHRAATLLQDMHTSMLDYLSKHDTYEWGQSMDMMLGQYSRGHNGTWTIATNLVGHMGEVGVFYQDRERFPDGTYLAQRLK